MLFKMTLFLKNIQLRKKTSLWCCNFAAQIRDYSGSMKKVIYRVYKRKKAEK